MRHPVDVEVFRVWVQYQEVLCAGFALIQMLVFRYLE